MQKVDSQIGHMSLGGQKKAATPPRWVVELNNPLPAKPKNASTIPDPPGFFSSKSASGKQVCPQSESLPITTLIHVSYAENVPGGDTKAPDS